MVLILYIILISQTPTNLYISALIYVASTARNLAISIAATIQSTLDSIYGLFTNVASSVWHSFALPVMNVIDIGDILLCSLIGSKHHQLGKASLMKVAQFVNDANSRNHQQVTQISANHKSGANKINKIRHHEPNLTVSSVPDYGELVKTLVDSLLMFFKSAIENLQESQSAISVSVQTQSTMRDCPQDQMFKCAHQSRLPWQLQSAEQSSIRRPITKRRQFSMSFQYKCEISFNRTIGFSNKPEPKWISTNGRNNLLQIRSSRSEPQLSLLGQTVA